MFAWFRRIRRISIFGFELEFNDPPENASGSDEPSGRPVKLPRPIKGARNRSCP